VRRVAPVEGVFRLPAGEPPPADPSRSGGAAAVLAARQAP
jgi:hypothetical protein